SSSSTEIRGIGQRRKSPRCRVRPRSISHSRATMARRTASSAARAPNARFEVMPLSFFARARRLLGRALRRRCPNCGGPGIFQGWFRMIKQCPTCGLPLERNEQGYAVGAYMFNIALAEIGFVICLIGGLLITWPDPPWRLLMGVSLALMLT